MLTLIGIGIIGIGAGAVFSGLVLQKWAVAAGGAVITLVGYLLT